MLDAIVVIWSSQKSAVLDNIGSGLLTRKKGQGWERTNETFSHICCQITAELDSINATQDKGHVCSLQCEEKITLTKLHDYIHISKQRTILLLPPRLELCLFLSQV